MYRRIRRNIGWKSLSIAVEKSLRLLLMFLIARALGPATFGQYTYAVALALLVVQMTDMGLGLFLTREIARQHMPANVLVGAVFTLKGVLGLGYLLVMGLVTWYHGGNEPLAWTLALAGLTSLATTTLEAIYQVFRGVQRLDLEARASSFHALVQAVGVGGGLLWLRHLDPKISDTPSAMLLVASGMLIASGIALAYTTRLLARVATPEYRWSREILGRFGREVLPLGIAIVASMVYFKIDVLMLSSMRGDVETGVYNLAYKLFENLSIVPAVLMAATFPALSHTVVADPPAAVALRRRTFRILLVVALGLMTAMLLLPWLGPIPRLIPYFLGPGYAGSVPVLQALAPSVLFTFVNYLETHMLVAMGLVRFQMAITVGLIGVNVLANLALIPLWGGVGAALATALTEAVLFAVCWPAVRRALRHRVRQAATEPARSVA